MAQILYMNNYPKPAEATSSYLNRPLRTEAQVIALRSEMMKREPVERPCDSGDGAA